MEIKFALIAMRRSNRYLLLIYPPRCPTIIYLFFVRVQSTVFQPTLRRTLATTRYATSHEWVKLDGDIATVGITDFAAKALGDVVYVDLPEVGASFSKG